MDRKLTVSATRTDIPLKFLRPGHDYPGSSINARRDHSEDSIAEMAAMLAAKGVLLNLIVCTAPDDDELYYVAAGGRRFAGAMLNARKGVKDEQSGIPFDGNYPMPCLVFQGVSPGEALDLSLTESEAQVPLHPIDRFEAYAAVAGDRRDDDTVAGIAKRYGKSVRDIRRHLALGALAPQIRAAWRNGDIDEEVAKAFTAAPDQEDQVKIYERLLSKGHRIDVPSVRKAFGGNELEATRLLGLVGRDAYLDAGGRLGEDLFRNVPIVHDMAKLKNLAVARIDEEIARLTRPEAEGGEGWGWAEQVKANANRWTHYAWRKGRKKPDYTDAEKSRIAEIKAEIKRIEDEESSLYDQEDLSDEQVSAIQCGLEQRGTELDLELSRIEAVAIARAYGAKDRKSRGVLIEVCADGSLSLEYGLKKPAEAKSSPKGDEDGASGKGTSKGPLEEAAANHHAAEALADARDAAVREALKAASPKVALAALIASLQFGQDSWRSYPVRAELETTPDAPFVAVAGASDWQMVFDTLLAGDGATIEDLAARLADAAACAAALSERVHVGFGADELALLRRLDGAVLQATVRRVMDWRSYFDGCNKPALLLIVKEALGEEEMRRHETKTAKQLAQFCLDSVVPTGWLPQELALHEHAAGAAEAETAVPKKKSRRSSKKADVAA